LPRVPVDGSFEFVSHTADIAVRLRGATREGLFEAAARALTEALTERAAVRAETTRHVELAARELDLLLVDWLDELLFLFEIEGFLVRDSEVAIARTDTASTDVITKPPTAPGSTNEEHEESLFRMDSPEKNPSASSALRERRDEYVISATLHGDTRDPARHRLKLLIKGVTYHGLHISETRQGCEATVIFDI
jgi:SHS2 domain-containing protein